MANTNDMRTIGTLEREINNKLDQIQNLINGTPSEELRALLVELNGLLQSCLAELHEGARAIAREKGRDLGLYYGISDDPADD